MSCIMGQPYLWYEKSLLPCYFYVAYVVLEMLDLAQVKCHKIIMLHNI